MSSYLWYNRVFGRAHFINEDKDGRWWRYGRLFIHPPGEKLPLQASFEWCIKRNPHSWGIELVFGGEDNTVGGSLGIPWVGNFYWHFRFLPWKLSNRLGLYEQRSVGFSVHSNTIWLSLLERRFGTYYSRAAFKKMGFRGRWRARFKEGMHWSFNYIDFLLGRAVYSDETLSEHDAVVTMPEDTYPVLVKLQRARWKRPRWKENVVLRAKVDVVERAIPCPGKGENSWDCDEDATYGITAPAETVEAAVEAMREASMRSRVKYGSGESWRPSREFLIPAERRPQRELA